MNFEDIKNESRLLFEAKLTPIQGKRFQPTGFPDLGAATYVNPSDGTNTLLVESVQSMANRLESVCLTESGELVDSLKGIPMITVSNGKRIITNSILSSHRLGSAYILEGDKNLKEEIQNEIGGDGKELDMNAQSKFHKYLFKTDPNSLLHGIFLAKKELYGGRLKLPRALSAFIEATEISEVLSGGAKIDHVNPGKDEDRNAESGFGNVPFSRMEYSAKNITVYFNLDMSQIAGYEISDDGKMFLIIFALWKIHKFLANGLRLRTACDLVLDGKLNVTRPKIKIPDMDELDILIKKYIKKCTNEFSKPREIEYSSSKKSKK